MIANAERNGLDYTWSGTALFAKRRRTLPPDQFEVRTVRTKRGITRRVRAVHLDCECSFNFVLRLAASISARAAFMAISEIPPQGICAAELPEGPRWPCPEASRRGFLPPQLKRSRRFSVADAQLMTGHSTGREPERSELKRAFCSSLNEP
jgi:hypothetical protein